MVAASILLGLVLAFFQNCGESTRQVQLQKEFSTPSERLKMKNADVMTYGSMKGHLDLSDLLSEGSEISLELVDFTYGENSEIQIRNQSPNLISFPFSKEGKCPSPEWFEQANADQSPVMMGAGYIVRDLSSKKFSYILFSGVLGSETIEGSFNLIQLSLKVIAPKPAMSFESFIKDLCEEPVLNDL